MPYLNIETISKSFGPTIAVDGVSLAVERGEIVCLLGPSGCGKTTLLRLVAGLEEADAGSIWLDGRELAAVPTFQRGIGMMFQSYALFPHMTVAQNIGYGLRMANESQTLISERVSEMLQLVDLVGLENRQIDQLSGGQQQRVALARSLATRPGVLLLDEPLGSLDRLLRERLQEELRAILKKVGVTALYVTHDQSEAFGIGDRVAVMNEGKIEQIDTSQTIYTRPRSRFVASFLGLSNLVESDKFELLSRNWLIDHLALNTYTFILIPPYAASLTGGEGFIPVEVTVLNYSFRGRFALLTCQVRDVTLEFSLDPYAEKELSRQIIEPGQRLEIQLGAHYILGIKG